VFLSCGDALFDLFTGQNSASGSGSSSAQGEHSASFVSLSGDAGGSPMNVAVGLARLEHQSRFFTNLSSDLFGQRLKRFLELNQVDISLSAQTQLNTTLAIVEKQPDGSADYAFYTDNTADVMIEPADIPSSLDDEIRLVHFGSYSTAVEPVASSLMGFAKRETQNRIISYDPNLRPSIEPDVDRWREVFNVFAATANVIKASDEDIATLLGKNREDQFVDDCFSHGAELVFITRGPDGASGFKADGTVINVAGASVDVVDTVGAGDTFQATLLHCLASQGHLAKGASLVGDVDIAASMELAVKAAAITCTRSGADLPYLSDL